MSEFTMAGSARAKALAFRTIARTPVHMPEWDITVYIGPSSVREFMENHGDGEEGEEKKDASARRYARICIAAAKTESGEAIFTAEDEAALTAQPFAALQRIVREYNRANGIGPDSQEKAGNA